MVISLLDCDLPGLRGGATFYGNMQHPIAIARFDGIGVNVFG
jgi:hypothetical protein